MLNEKSGGGVSFQLCGDKGRARLTRAAGMFPVRRPAGRHGVGAGAIGMTALVLLYPRTPIARLVGSDIAHAVPLTLIAGVGHWLLGSVDWVLLSSLVIGSLPGIFFGSHLSARVPDKGCGRSSRQSSSS